MASLKEIKERIASVRSTRKITSAMKMVAAAKLHRTQRAIGALVPYADELQAITSHLVGGEGVPPIALATQREAVGRATVIAFASNGTLCGAYNGNVVRKAAGVVGEWQQQGAEVEVVAVGEQLAKGLHRLGITPEEGHEEFADKPTYEMAQRLAQRMMTAYAEGHTDRVDVVYYKFISAGTQRLVCEQLLPIEIGPAAEEGARTTEYILEPDRTELIASIVPRQITLKIYAAALSASASEHAARMMAMQAATDNADTLIADLALEYNKQRQQAITTELLDIMGGQNGR